MTGVRPRTARARATAATTLALLALALAARPAHATTDEVQPPAPGASSTAASTAGATSPAPVATSVTPPPGPISDHDAVVGHWGIEARRIAAAPYPLALLPSGCAGAGTAVSVAAPPAAPCTVDLGAIALRHWTTRNLAWNVGLAFALGGGRQGAMALDTYYGLGPIGGVTLLLGNWRHLAIGASPEASVIYFKPSGGGGAGTKLVTFRAQLEGELHFGFVDVPALSVGITTGLVFQYESAPGAATWSVSVDDARSVWGTLSSLFIRYYL